MMSSLVESLSERYWNFPSAERKTKENAGKTLQSLVSTWRWNWTDWTDCRIYEKENGKTRELEILKMKLFQSDGKPKSSWMHKTSWWCWEDDKNRTWRCWIKNKMINEIKRRSSWFTKMRIYFIHGRFSVLKPENGSSEQLFFRKGYPQIAL